MWEKNWFWPIGHEAKHKACNSIEMSTFIVVVGNEENSVL